MYTTYSDAVLTLVPHLIARDSRIVRILSKYGKYGSTFGTMLALTFHNCELLDQICDNLCAMFGIFCVYQIRKIEIEISEIATLSV